VPMFVSEIDKDAINKLEIRQFEGEVVVVDDMKSYRAAMKELKHYNVLGIDTETKPSFKKGESHDIALIQISNHEISWLFRINKIGIPKELKALLEDEDVLKVGAGLHDDINRLHKMIDFYPAGFLDLQKYVEAFMIESKSLKKLVAIVLGYKISKSQQMSNWEAEELTEAQQRYGATDAWVCLEIYDRLRASVNGH